MNEISDADRTTAMGLLTDAKDMLAAAKLLHVSDVWEVRRPTYYLLGHSIEVALKSFLLANGTSPGTLKKKLGHNLAKTARRSSPPGQILFLRLFKNTYQPSNC